MRDIRYGIEGQSRTPREGFLLPQLLPHPPIHDEALFGRDPHCELLEYTMVDVFFGGNSDGKEDHEDPEKRHDRGCEGSDSLRVKE